MASEKENPPAKDPEANHPTPRSSFAKDLFTDLLRTIQEKDYHVDPDKRAVYAKLMDHLDAVEQPPRISTSASVLILGELLLFLGLLSALSCSLALTRINQRRLLGLRVWQYVAMALMVTSGLSAVRLLTFALTWPVKRWGRTHKYAIYFIRQLKPCADVTLWFCLVLSGWYVWFRPRLRRVHGDVSVVVTRQVTRFLIALCLGSFLWLLKNVLYLKLEADLHYEQLFERVRMSVVYLHGLQIVHRCGMWRFLPDNKTKRELMRLAARGKLEGIAADDGIWIKGENVWMLVKEMEKESVPIWILRRLEEEYLDQVRLRPLPGNTQVTRDDQKVLREVIKMFKQLVKNQIKDTKSDTFSYSDLEIKRRDLEGKPYSLNNEELDFIFKSKKFEDEEEDETDTQAISSGTPEERNISYDEFLNWAVRAYKNCWGLERTLNNSKRVFIKLNRLLSAFLLMVVLIIWLILSGIVNTGQLAVLFSPFIAASFIFGDSCRKMFEGLIFAFAMHPFDVGDRVVINNVQMRVTNLKILTSCFHKYDTGEEVIVPNSTLTTTSIVNLDITPDQCDKVEFIIDARTPLEDVRDLEIKISKFLDDDIEYSSNSKVVKSEIWREEMKMTVYFKYLVSYLSAESKAVHRSKILSMIIKFRSDMEKKMKDSNDGSYPTSYRTHILEIKLHSKIKLKDIEDLRDEIIWCVDGRHKLCAKVVIMDLEKSQVKMGLYVHPSYPNMEENGSKDERKSQSHMWVLRSISKKIHNHMEDVSGKLIKYKFVKDVKIYLDDNAKPVIHSSKGWGSFGLKDVIQSQEHSPQQESSPLDTIPSGDLEKDGEASEEPRHF